MLRRDDKGFKKNGKYRKIYVFWHLNRVIRSYLKDGYNRNHFRYKGGWNSSIVRRNQKEKKYLTLYAELFEVSLAIVVMRGLHNVFFSGYLFIYLCISFMLRPMLFILLTGETGIPPNRKVRTYIWEDDLKKLSF